MTILALLVAVWIAANIIFIVAMAIGKRPRVAPRLTRAFLR
jgi:hypothetical protein